MTVERKFSADRPATGPAATRSARTSRIGRRAFAIGLTSGATTASLPRFAIAQRPAKVVIVGGGPGGATVAGELMRVAPTLDVTLIEADPVYTTCFFSNLYLGGQLDFDRLRHGYDGLARLGVKIVHARASAVDTDRRRVDTADGASLSYDRLVVAPGIDFKYGEIEGLTPAAAQRMPHAYVAGEQTRLLKQQIDAMPDGGTVLIAPPKNPYRCPPAPYERACAIAHLLKTTKPRSKLVIYDPKTAFSKQELFSDAFKRVYDGIVEVNVTNEIDDFGLASVDPKAMTVTLKTGDTVKADVANVIPSQRAGEIAFRAGLTDGDWCPIDPATFRSRKIEGVYVLGDAAVTTEIPKSAFGANGQGKLVAADIVSTLLERPRDEVLLSNICWSWLAPDDSVKLGAKYVPKSDASGTRLEAVGAFISKVGENTAVRKATFDESVAWYSTIVADVWKNER